jgi:hypothetical protein
MRGDEPAITLSGLTKLKNGVAPTLRRMTLLYLPRWAGV